MTATRLRRPRATQPELPLSIPDGVPPLSPAGSIPLPDWRLDEHTRRIGREGIAEARARLADASSAAGRAGGGEDRSDRAA